MCQHHVCQRCDRSITFLVVVVVIIIVIAIILLYFLRFAFPRVVEMDGLKPLGFVVEKVTFNLFGVVESL